jgi:hypothetical protein
MAFAPTPMFAAFGELMAVMILISVVVALLVLPSLLIVVTPRRKGEERDELEAAVTEGDFRLRPTRKRHSYKNTTHRVKNAQRRFGSHDWALANADHPDLITTTSQSRSNRTTCEDRKRMSRSDRFG